MKEINLRVGNDNGNSEHKMIIEGELIVQPNVYADVRKLPLLDDINIDACINDIQNNLIVSIDSPALGTSGTYFIGTYAISTGHMLKNIGVGAANSKFNSDIPIINTISRIAGYAAKKAYLEDNSVEKVKVNVEMTTGLPVNQYSKNKAFDFAKKFMDGTHNATVIAGLKRINVEIKFVYVKALPESTPSIFYLQSRKAKDPIFKTFNELNNLNVNGDYFKDKRILHCAIGEGTTEFPLTIDIDFDPNFIEGTNNGIGHAINRVLNDFKKANYLTKFSRQEYSIAIKDKDHKFHDKAIDFVYNEVRDESQVIFETLEEQIEKANNLVDIVMIHGGGSILAKKFIYDKLVELGKERGILIYYLDGMDAVSLEVKGMYEFVNGEIFDYIKKQYINKAKAEKQVE